MKHSSTIATPHYRQGVTSLVLLTVLLAAVRTVPLILAGIAVGIFVFNQAPGSALLVHSNSPFLAALVVGAALQLPVPTLFEIPLGYSLFVAGIRPA